MPIPPPLLPHLDPADVASGRADLANHLHTLAIHLLRRVATVDRASGLTPERLSLLSVLVIGGPRSVRELAVAERVSSAAISRTLNALEDLGLADRRREGSPDRRIVTVSATPAGEAVLVAGRSRRIALLLTLMDGLDADAVDLLRRALGPLEAICDAEAPGRVAGTGRQDGPPGRAVTGP